MPWFRLYTEFASDPTVQLLSEAMQRRYVMLLCLAGSRLTPTENIAAIGYALRLSPEDVAETKRALCGAGLIDEGWFPPAWDRRQRVSDHDAAERKRRQRAGERRRANGHYKVMNASRDSHAIDQTRTDQTRPEETRQDSEKIPSAPTNDSPEFAEFRAIYPHRSGRQPWVRALEAIRARRREGCTWSEILEGARRYAAYCKAMDKVGSEFVMQAATFCGPEKSFREPWTLPPSKAQRQQDSNADTALAWVQGTVNAAH